MRQIRKGFLLVAGASVLAACASHGPTNSPAPASATGATPVAAAAASDAGKTAVPKGYKLVVKKGNEYFCRTQAVTGSHTLRTEICLTPEEFEAQKNHSVMVGLNPPAPGQGSSGNP